MELQLKEYQQRALDVLSQYFRASVRLDARTAFEQTTREVFGQAIPYRDVKELPGLPYVGLPYVCIRLPTGGGKTLLATHSVGVALRDLLERDHCVVLWLVPSNTIREQTLKALWNRTHPYRRALDRSTGPVSVLDVTGALTLQSASLEAETVVIVSTIQAFRREDTEGMKVYKDSGYLMEHFRNLVGIPESSIEKLDRYDDGTPLRSLANVLCLRRPVVIVDEAHNARTPLSFDTLARFNPSCIIELTATPDLRRNPSNVLYSASAAELYAEDMIKMPIRLETRADWKELLGDAVATRKRLEKLARRETAEYLRPIMLVQAQPRSQRRQAVTVDAVRQCLVDDFHIEEKEIAVATGDRDELGTQDVLARSCPIRYVVTVQKLREGWDCPFAYVLATIAELQSSRPLEQILGRVMRLPGAKRKEVPELNRAYAFAASENIAKALGSLVDTLVEIGFERTEAKDLIVPEVSQQDQGDLFGATAMRGVSRITVQVPEPLAVERLSPEAREVVDYDAASGSLIVCSPMPDGVREELERLCTSKDAARAIRVAQERSQSLGARAWPVDRGVPFEVPALAIRQGDFLDIFEDTHFLDHEWKLTHYEAVLTAEEYSPSKGEVQLGQITVSDEGRLKHFVEELHGQLTALSGWEDWSVAELASWLDNTIIHRDIPSIDTGAFLIRVIEHLTTERGIPLAELVHDKYRLRRRVEDKIEACRTENRKNAHQTFLVEDSPLEVTPEVCFSYPRSESAYGTSSPYKGSREFQRHYYPRIFDLDDKGEEYDCACFIDGVEEMDFWVRNIANRPSQSFWLQTSTDKFYPDFVCRLKDNRFLVVEYKGADRWTTDDSKEKRHIGEFWERRSKRKCLFVMPRGTNFDEIRAKVRAANTP